MKNKEVIKMVFDDKFNRDTMKKDILKRSVKDKKKPYYILKYAGGLCLILVLVLIFMKQDNSFELKVPITGEQNIYINELSEAQMGLIDADIKTISNDINVPWYSMFDGIEIPSDVDKFHGYAIYTRKTRDGEYNILNCYVYDYFNLEDDKNIRIAFSSEYEPVRDYYFEDIGNISIINNIELKIYKYNDSYMARFQYQGYKFDIETQGITEKEFITLLKSIIKEEK